MFLKRVNLGAKDVVMLYCRDLRQQREMLAKLEASIEKEQATSNAKTRFLSHMSHEIRTPMNAIIGMTSIARTTTDPKRNAACLAKIEKASNHMLGILNQILDMSKIEADKFEIYSHPFEFKAMLNGIIGVLGIHIEEKQLNFIVDVDKVIPQYIISDELRLAQVLTNLLANAVKFTPHGGTVRLSVNWLTSGGNDKFTLHFEISDTGIGISPEQQTRLFSPFEQAEASTTRKFGGTGLGLVISKKIIEMMGGKIWVKSEIGDGSKFIFAIQFKEDDIIGYYPSIDPEAPPQDESAYNFKNFTILIAEDVEINREIIIALLESTEVNIECAENGLQALQMFAAAPDRYDIILMDIQMPEMDGLTATRKIRGLEIEKAKTIPIIAMTANVFKEDVHECLAAGMDGHLGKPLDMPKVMEKLKKYLV